ncbi:putative virion structural protein [Pseudomonas phage OBP]|uniref:internal head protein n=1 Tax=Pseudomonas phage OBP TaxID=1124849 RepID=UPI000240D49D|nr:internal head protein [Pseudomonas phage OBP]AEV89548.1 putative virion structural protein [Pseudomonas phage OBP]
MSYQDLFKNILGGESAELTPSQVDVIEKTAEEVAEDIIERDIAVAEKDFAVTQTTLEAHSDKLEVLDGLVEDLEESLDGMEAMTTGHFNPELFASHYNKAVKIGNRFGLNLERHGVESFSSKETANYTVHAGVESLKEVGKKAVEEGKKILVEIWNSLIAGISNFVTIFSSVKTKAQGLLDGLSEDKLVTGTVKLPSDSFLLYNGKTNDFYKRLVSIARAFNNYTPNEDSYTNMVNSIEGKIGDGGKVVANKDSGSVSVEKAGEGKSESQALGLNGVKSLLLDVVEGTDELLKAQANTKQLQMKRDQAIAKMGSGAKEENFVNQKKYGRLSCKLVLQAMAVHTRILKAQFAVAKANFK